MRTPHKGDVVNAHDERLKMENMRIRTTRDYGDDIPNQGQLLPVVGEITEVITNSDSSIRYKWKLLSPNAPVPEYEVDFDETGLLGDDDGLPYAYEIDQTAESYEVADKVMIHRVQGVNGIQYIIQSAPTTSTTSEAEARHFSYKAHIDVIKDDDSEADPFWSIPSVLESMVQFGIEVRVCVGYGGEGEGTPPAKHPGFKGSVLTSLALSTAQYVLRCGAEGDDVWIPVAHVHVDATGGATMYTAAGRPHVEVRVNAAGDMQFRIFYGGYPINIISGIMTIDARVIAYPKGLDVPELGTSNVFTLDGKSGVEHEWGIPANPDPVTATWPDSKWRD